MEPKPIGNCTHFKHPTDEQLRHVDIYFLAPKIICSLSTLNFKIAFTASTQRMYTKEISFVFLFFCFCFFYKVMDKKKKQKSLFICTETTDKGLCNNYQEGGS